MQGVHYATFHVKIFSSLHRLELILELSSSKCRPLVSTSASFTLWGIHSEHTWSVKSGELQSFHQCNLFCLESRALILRGQLSILYLRTCTRLTLKMRNSSTSFIPMSLLSVATLLLVMRIFGRTGRCCSQVVLHWTTAV